MNDINEKIIPVHTESIDSNDSLETCIICLDDVDENTIYFPSKYSSCSCKYTIHLRCIKENNINGCVICKSQIIYPVQNDLIQIDMFESNNTDADPDINTRNLDVNIYRHETQDACEFTNKKVYICIFCATLSIVFSILIWFMSTQIQQIQQIQ
tara:strand:+ start:151 stop:612 length:462 start_codon:yes stop_codon:yes gene_type:complete